MNTKSVKCLIRDRNITNLRASIFVAPCIVMCYKEAHALTRLHDLLYMAKHGHKLSFAAQGLHSITI